MKSITTLFFGPQGSGKGTQVKLLINLLKQKSDNGIVHIDMGQLLRNMVGNGGYTADLTGNVINNGIRMPDFMPIYLTTDALVGGLKDGSEHIIADGLARGPDQTRGWDDAMQFYGRTDYHIIALDISEEESIKRLVLRGRNDDTPEAIKNRLGWHKTEVEPQLAMLVDRGRIVHRINGDRAVEVVHADIVKTLGI